MYSFMGIWAILEELLSFKVIATLHDMIKKNNDERVKQRIYDKVIYSTSDLPKDGKSK